MIKLLHFIINNARTVIIKLLRGLSLQSIGVYSVCNYSVVQREELKGSKKEFGINFKHIRLPHVKN